MPRIPANADARTTRRWLRLPALLLLLGMAAYFLGGWYYALGRHPTGFFRENPYFFWLGNWQMFTRRSRTNTVIEADALLDGGWQEIDLEELFPAKWESGLRFERKPFYRNAHAMAVLASATCGRMADHPDMKAPPHVRFRRVRWRKTLGSTEQPRDEDVRQSLLIVWDCSQRVTRPQGTRL